MDFQKSQKCQIVGIPQIFSSKYMHFLTLFLDANRIWAKKCRIRSVSPKNVLKMHIVFIILWNQSQIQKKIFDSVKKCIYLDENFCGIPTI